MKEGYPPGRERTSVWSERYPISSTALWISQQLVILVARPETKQWWRNFREERELEVLVAGELMAMNSRAIIGADQPAVVDPLHRSCLHRLPKADRHLSGEGREGKIAGGVVAWWRGGVVAWWRGGVVAWWRGGVVVHGARDHVVFGGKVAEDREFIRKRMARNIRHLRQARLSSDRPSRRPATRRGTTRTFRRQSWLTFTSRWR